MDKIKELKMKLVEGLVRQINTLTKLNLELLAQKEDIEKESELIRRNSAQILSLVLEAEDLLKAL